jgi:cystathionine beta-lyase/cystathionine gamma-synthase
LDLSLDGQEKAGVVRIHVGLEGEEEIIRDLERALKLI